LTILQKRRRRGYRHRLYTLLFPSISFPPYVVSGQNGPVRTEYIIPHHYCLVSHSLIDALVRAKPLIIGYVAVRTAGKTQQSKSNCDMADDCDLAMKRQKHESEMPE
jgi:hypothetical protein